MKNPDQPPKAEQSERDETSEELALEQIDVIAVEIKAAREKDPQHNVDGHWAAAVHRLSITFDGGFMTRMLEKKGWTEDTFPSELATESTESDTN